MKEIRFSIDRDLPEVEQMLVGATIVSVGIERERLDDRGTLLLGLRDGRTVKIYPGEYLGGELHLNIQGDEPSEPSV